MATLARDLMETQVLTIPAEMRFLEIQHLFVVAQVYGAPVVDAGGKVVGLLSAIDLLGAADQAFDEDADAGEPQDLAARLEALTATDLASPDVVWVSPEMPVDRVAELMGREGIHRVLVGEDGQLLGILTTFDLLQAVRA
ncbi:MAG TPA: CBS domain-containing protein [Kofleriaceae bacterium]|nr:CBS domain-containing protein [Kofleriaceae bacterium]